MAEGDLVKTCDKDYSVEDLLALILVEDAEGKPCVKTSGSLTNSNLGWFDYNDLATQTAPITITGGGGFVDLTNDELGSFTNKLFPPLGITDVYDASLNVFDFTQLKLGDTVDIRLDLEVTTSSVNTEVDVILLMADGVGSYPTPFLSQQNYKNTGSYDVNRYNGVYMGDLNTLNNSAKFQIKSDKTCTVVVRGWYCKINRI